MSGMLLPDQPREVLEVGQETKGVQLELFVLIQESGDSSDRNLCGTFWIHPVENIDGYSAKTAKFMFRALLTLEDRTQCTLKPRKT